MINKRKLNDKRFRKGKIPLVHEYIKQKLKNKQSPWQIQNHILEDTGYYLGKDAIYNHIYKTGIELTAVSSHNMKILTNFLIQNHTLHVLIAVMTRVLWKISMD